MHWSVTGASWLQLVNRCFTLRLWWVIGGTCAATRVQCACQETLTATNMREKSEKRGIWVWKGFSRTPSVCLTVEGAQVTCWTAVTRCAAHQLCFHAVCVYVGEVWWSEFGLSWAVVYHDKLVPLSGFDAWKMSLTETYPIMNSVLVVCRDFNLFLYVSVMKYFRFCADGSVGSLCRRIRQWVLWLC